MEQDGSAKIKKSSSTAPEVPNSARPVLGIVGVTAFYPMTVVRTLAQVGYEPQPATIGPSLWTRTPGRYYPNLLSYANFLRKREGFTVLFTGLTPRIVSSLTSTAIEDAISAKIRAAIPDRSGDGDKSVRAKGLASTMYDMTVACAAKTVGVAVTQPLQVVMVRMICSIASEDQVYSGFFSTIKEIYQTEGFSGFFR
ncbi:MTCH2 [Bugula neritina]|uniref:MTCH2 n=1 Tax=Bugula neritina TaxID=10212 RepID=A0A7J7JRY7_BUGNE|nr:MTCH2 [Bugula neritina]